MTQWTGLNEIREKYLSFFEPKGHLRLESFSLVLSGDNNLLLINSDMTLMKKYFTDEVTPPRKRVTTCQKCIRTPDTERVGITTRHGTYFEILGNFPFGDYLRHEATAWAWEFCTKVIALPEDHVWVTTYQDDDEAFEIWTKEVGVFPNRIVRPGKGDNFREHGSGPCGPCSELHSDCGEQYGCGSPICGPGCDCDHYVEFWNLMFTQFDSNEKGTYAPLDHPNIDTGMGLERLTCIMQGVDNLFLVDTVQNIMKHVSRIADIHYSGDSKNGISLRVITGHIHSTTFIISGGVILSNEGRGYVLCRLLRRTVRHGKLIGINRPLLFEVTETVIAENKNAYPELVEKRDMIVKLIHVEEESFARMIGQGLQLLNHLMQGIKGKVFSGEDAFHLNDTYGFPLDLIKEIVAEQDMTVDEETSRRLMTEQKQRARTARENAGADAWAGDANGTEELPATAFVGYEALLSEAEVPAVIKDGERVDSAGVGDEVTLVLSQSPFYAESGGQVGDTGMITAEDTGLAVTDTTKDHSDIFLHRGKITAGRILEGDVVTAKVNGRRHAAIMCNHTAAYLLQAALHRVLGAHVEQAGQLVNDEHVRFDFTHFSVMTPEELQQTEALVNQAILGGISVECREMPIKEVKKLGVMALFGGKYGDVIRMVSAGEFSRGLRGDMHVDNTAKLGLFRIVSESPVAAGTRRIGGVTGTGVLALLSRQTELMQEVIAALKANNVSDPVQCAKQVAVELKEKDREIESLTEKLASVRISGMLASAQPVDGVRMMTAVPSGTGADALCAMYNQIKSQQADVVAVLAGVTDGKATIAATAGTEVQKLGVHAGKFVGQVAKLAGGNGGGKPDLAMAGAKDPSKLEETLSAANEIIAAMFK